MNVGDPPAAGPRRRLRVRWILLVSALLGCAAYLYWDRVQQPQVALRRARVLATRDPLEAERMVSTAIAQRGGSFPAAQLLHAQLLLALGRDDEALGQFTLIEDPQQLPADELCDLARSALSRNQTLLARKAFQAVQSDSELFPQAQRSLVQIYLQLGWDEQVEAACRDLLERNPTDSTAWQILGTLAMNDKDLSEAEAAFRECLTHSDDPQQLQKTREDLIQVLIDQGDAQRARDELDILRDSTGGLSGRAVIEEAYVFRLQGEPQAGIDVLDPLISGSAEFATRARFLRGLLYGDLGMDEQAAADLARVVAVQPWNKEAHHKLSVAYSRLGNTEQAASHRATAEKLTNLAAELLDLASRLKSDPTNLSLRRRVADLYTRLGQPDQARRLLSVVPSASGARPSSDTHAR